MTTDPFEGCRAKIERAKFHLKKLESHIRTSESDLHGLIKLYDDPETGERVIQAALPKTLFLGLSVVAGEIVHQARSSLDHLVWALLIENGATPKRRESGFPIFWERDKYEDKGRRMIKGLRPASVAIIDGLQPIKPDYATDPLYVLNELWNSEKHRVLNFTSIRLNAFQEGYCYPADSPKSGHYIRSPIISVGYATEDGAELGRFHPPSDLTPDVQVIQQADVSGPFFQDAGPATGHEVLKLLPHLVQTIEGITDELIASARY